MSAKIRKKYLVDASFVRPRLPHGVPLFQETWAFSEAQAIVFITNRLRSRLKRFINPHQLSAMEDSSADPIPSRPRAKRQPERTQRLLELPLFNTVK